MNDHVTTSTFQLFERFPDAESARLYLEGRLWPNGPVCPECKSGERITVRKAGYYRCNACVIDFTVRTGTIFERSHVPLHKWVYAMYLLGVPAEGEDESSKAASTTESTCEEVVPGALRRPSLVEGVMYIVPIKKAEGK